MNQFTFFSCFLPLVNRQQFERRLKWRICICCLCVCVCLYGCVSHIMWRACCNKVGNGFTSLTFCYLLYIFLICMHFETKILLPFIGQWKSGMLSVTVTVTDKMHGHWVQKTGQPLPFSISENARKTKKRDPFVAKVV